jgi:uncharacterized protein (TIGR03435 family)
MKSNRKWWAASALLLIFTMACRAPQTPPAPEPLMPEWQRATGSRMQFETATVKPSEPGAPFESNVNLDGMDGPSTGNELKANAPLIAYLFFAYKITDSNLAGVIYQELPGWAQAPQFFTIEARAAGTPSRDQLRLMMQALLTDRFKLATHWEKVKFHEPSFVLSQAETGQKFQPHPSDKPCVHKPGESPVIEVPGEDSQAPRYCGIVTWHKDGQQYVRINNMRQAQMIQYLNNGSMEGGLQTSYSTVDGLGLTGLFDMDLQFRAGAKIPGPMLVDAVRKRFSLVIVYQEVPKEMMLIFDRFNNLPVD